ncbi:pentatricopeptide repeat-containing protein At1g77360, mitochondrial-like [Cornus florida]|uniref:pentatricopeptide repeat-containing protein At1g77360, mitochondrial-like n=1 Tax=Cornus florida TaxID=4283 RepID=UPI0028973C3F|nr:pentatricopeptide repeat-containing protein At1g77360, mitochondrial-like [Cornus florida]XP_059671126.1 pentatricopeptide repeat-containing protein At1g77360, mitochondrial-like [Cornus florida]XP_059671127.1 pentatricopeptide repeat-containing protein At1g77360, mitochondrial-like [Cornus florida]
MDKHKKRPRGEDSSSSSSNVDHNKKPHSSSTSKPPTSSAQIQQQQMGKRPNFSSYLETPNLPPKIKLLCEIIANTRSLHVEKVLDDMGVRLSQPEVEEVLKLSYGFPGPAGKFFRWSGRQLNDNHSPYAWNLVVDLLGKNGLFEAMWDAIKSMKKEGLLSLATFASVFSSYVIADRVKEAIMTFDVMDQYGCPRDIVALNSLFSAICREGRTEKANEFLGVVKNMIRPDADTYAILLEGWENEGDVVSARRTFAEMVSEIGWDPRNVAAYDSFLTTLLKGPDGMLEVIRSFETMQERRCFPGMKFFKIALDDCVKKGDVKGARLLWDGMAVRNGFRPDTGMYTSMIALHCYLNDIDAAKELLDEMICHGVFPDSQTYNVLLQFLIKSKRFRDASPIFTEMIKNECVPNHTNCKAAVRGYMDSGEPYMAIKVWKWMIENYDSDLEETGNLLVLGLRVFNRVPEAVKYAEDMIDRGIKLNSSTLSKLRQSLSKAGKAFAYDELLRKWKTH